MSPLTTPPGPGRCAWAESDELLRQYHDTEWGVPVHDDRRLFEYLNLEGAQAGLSWITVLRRREGYRRAFDNFNASIIAEYDEAKLAELLQDVTIIRNRLKTQAVIANARSFLVVQQERGGFHNYLWNFVDHQPLTGARKRQGLVISEKMSKDLKKHGFRFVGPTICYAFMQATGMINDHEPACFKARG